MVQKHRIHTEVGVDHRINVNINQKFDVLEVLSLKFTQKDIYSSENCSRYGVVVGRVTSNNGFGIPNARVSIFIPQTDNDMDDPVISSLYPYKTVYDRDDDGYRYNLLPKRKQHGGHNPTGSFMDQEDILNREEYMEVFEKYYTFTVKTNDAGDFMIWGVPIGLQTLHVDIDLSDIGCFSLRPYDFIRKGYGVEEFDRIYRFKSSDDVDSLPQIVSFDKTIEVFPFWGNDSLCDVSITRSDFDLSERGIRIDPVALILLSSVTDDTKDSVKRSGRIRRNTGFKCNLQTTSGTVECVRYTGNYIYGSDGVTRYPELEYHTIPEVIDENGVLMTMLPMNMDYVYTDQYGNLVTTNNPDKGIPTTSTSRFRVSLDFSNDKVTTAKYLIPNIREFTPNSDGTNGLNEYSEALLLTYQFSDVFEDYINYLPPSGVTLNSTGFGDTEKEHKKSLMLGGDNNGIPEDYFYKFLYGKVYTVTSFQGTRFDSNRRDAFLGIKQIRPAENEDCASDINYVPTNYGYRNRISISLILSQAQIFLQFIVALVLVRVGEMLSRFAYVAKTVFYNIGIRRWRPFRRFSEMLEDLTYRIQDRFTQQLPLTIYPDCEECITSDEEVANDLSFGNNYCRVAEFTTNIKVSDDYIFLSKWDAVSSFYYMNTPASLSRIDGEPVKDDEGGCTGTTILPYSSLTNIHTQTITPEIGDPNNHRFFVEVYPYVFTGTGETDPNITTFGEFVMFLNGKNDYPEDTQFRNAKILGEPTYSTYLRILRKDWNELSGMDEDVTTEELGNLHAVIMIYDRGVIKEEPITGTTQESIEGGCERYDTTYNESIVLSYIWSTSTIYGTPITPLDPKIGKYDNVYWESKTPPTDTSYSNLLSTVIGAPTTGRLPYRKIWLKIPNTRYDRKTKSGLSEFRDGTFTIIPVARGRSYNVTAIREWYRRKRVGMLFCGGVVNYSFVDNWLHGLLYFFKFDRRIRWDDRGEWDLSQRRSKYPRSLVFYNVFENTFYYRSTPYRVVNGVGTFIGQSNDGVKEILHPTTFYDVGVRDEFFHEICVDSRVNPTCSVVRDISPTSYQDPGNILEHAINYRMDISNGAFDIDSFFTGDQYGDRVKSLNGDIIQMMSMNCEVGVEPFDLDSPHYYLYNGELMDPEDPYFESYFRSGNLYGPTPIDLKLDVNGVYKRLCLNNRMSDTSQVVPFYLWDKRGVGFGSYVATLQDTQRWDRTQITSMKIQKMFSVSGVTDTITNYLMADGEEEYILKPMTITHPTYVKDGLFEGSLERFEVISVLPPETTVGGAVSYVEGDLWLHVTSGTVDEPENGNIYVVVNQTWKLQSGIQYTPTTVFIPETTINYSGNKQVLSTPFLFCFGIKAGRTSLDMLVKYFGEKGAFNNTLEGD